MVGPLDLARYLRHSPAIIRAVNQALERPGQVQSIALEGAIVEMVKAPDAFVVRIRRG